VLLLLLVLVLIACDIVTDKLSSKAAKNRHIPIRRFRLANYRRQIAIHRKAARRTPATCNWHLARVKMDERGEHDKSPPLNQGLMAIPRHFRRARHGGILTRKQQRSAKDPNKEEAVQRFRAHLQIPAFSETVQANSVNS
jgi:hypothetical protein